MKNLKNPKIKRQKALQADSRIKQDVISASENVWILKRLHFVDLVFELRDSRVPADKDHDFHRIN